MFSAKVKIKINKEVTKELMQQIDWGLDDIADMIFARSQELCPVDESTLKKSGHTDKTTPFSKSVYYDAPHAPYLEFGTAPHMPPVKPLIEWARRVLALSPKDAESAGWAIAMKIKERGGIPHPFLRPALDEMAARAKEIIEARLK